MSSNGGGDSTKAIFERHKLEYEDMRIRLLETEEKLQNLRKLEEEVQSVTSETTDKISSVSNCRSAPYKSWHDDSDSLSSAFSTVPASYTGFSNQKVNSSTPSKKQHKNKSQFRRDHADSDTSNDSTKENRSNVKYERKLLLQNQRLLLEVERLIGDLHSSKIENATLLKEFEEAKKIPDLEERIEELSAEGQAQDKALRDAERHLELGAKQNSELHKQVEDLTADVADLRAEIEEHKETKKVIESQRDEAIQNVLEMQESWEDYQRRAKEKYRKMEENEDSIQDSLNSVSTQRDDLLDQLAEAETALASHEAEINRLLREVDIECSQKQKAEDETANLRRQLDQLTAQLAEFEKVSRLGEEMREEKLELEKEISEHRLVAQDVRELLALFQNKQYNNSLQQKESGNIAMEPQRDVLTLNNSAALNCNNNGLSEGNFSNSRNQCASNQFAELRNLFCNMDSEIQRLRSDLKQRDSDDRTYINLREELAIIMEKAEKGMAQNTELECIIVSLEENKKQLECKLDEACRGLEDKVRQLQMLDTRLSERNRQVVCLQEDNSTKNQKICALESQIRDAKKKMDVMSETNQPCSDDTKVRELEDILHVKEASFAELQMKFLNQTKESKAQIKVLEKKLQCLSDQVAEFQRQIEISNQETDKLRKELVSAHAAKDTEKRHGRSKEQQLKTLEHQIEEEKTMCEEKEKMNAKMLSSLQAKLTKSQESNTELDSALMMCKQEVSKHLQTMDEVRKHFDSQIQQKDYTIKQLNESIRKANEDLECKNHEINSLEHAAMTLKCKVDQVFKSLQEAENMKMCLSEKLKQCEKKGLSEKTTCLKEMEDLERKLTQALNNLQVATGEISKLKQIVAEKSSMVECLTLEKNSCSRDLQLCKQKAIEKAELLAKMEKDNQELCTQLQHKMECIKDMETVLCNKDHDLKTCTRCLDELNQKFLAMNNNKGDQKSELKMLVDKLKGCTDDLLKKNRLLVECEEALKRCQMDCQGRQDEIDQLNIQMAELNCKLQERIVKVEELEKAIEAIHKDTEKRMKRVDEQLRRYECELTDKVRQLTDMDECLTTCQEKLTQKANECCHLEQRNNRMCCDLQVMEGKYKDLEEQRQIVNRQLNESKGENAEVTQQLRVTREELQSHHCELVETRGSLMNCNREVEKVRRQLEEAHNCLEAKTCELKKCCGERNDLLNKVSNIQVRMEQEACRAAQQFADYRSHMEKEMENCRTHSAEIEESNCLLSQKLTCTTRQLQSVEKNCHQKLDSLNRELEDLLHRLSDREEQISTLKDCISQKDSEMMKLKLKLCSCENACNNNSLLFDISCEEQHDNLVLDTATGTSKVHSGRSVEDNNAGNRLSVPVTSKSRSERGSHSSDRDQQQHQHQGQGQEDVQSEEGTNASSARNSLGVSEVHERLRSNQRLQLEIEKQLRCLEDDIQEVANSEDV